MIQHTKRKKICAIFYDLYEKAITYSPGIPVPSAQLSLTSLFGMGRGVPQRYHHFKNSTMFFINTAIFIKFRHSKNK